MEKAGVRRIWMSITVARIAFLIPLGSSLPASSQCALIPPGPGFHYGGMKYVLTPKLYDPTPDVQEKIAAEYGARARLADWETLKSALSNPAALEAFVAEVGIPFQPWAGLCDNIFVAVRGRTNWMDAELFLHGTTEKSRNRIWCSTRSAVTRSISGDSIALPGLDRTPRRRGTFKRNRLRSFRDFREAPRGTGAPLNGGQPVFAEGIAAERCLARGAFGPGLQLRHVADRHSARVSPPVSGSAMDGSEPPRWRMVIFS